MPKVLNSGPVSEAVETFFDVAEGVILANAVGYSSVGNSDAAFVQPQHLLPLAPPSRISDNGRLVRYGYLLEAVVDGDESDDHECQPGAHKRQADCQ